MAHFNDSGPATVPSFTFAPDVARIDTTATRRCASMLDRLELTCEGPQCERELAAPDFRLSFAEGETVRRVYECRCGSITITLGRRRVA